MAASRISGSPMRAVGSSLSMASHRAIPRASLRRAANARLIQITEPHRGDDHLKLEVLAARIEQAQPAQEAHGLPREPRQLGAGPFDRAGLAQNEAIRPNRHLVAAHDQGIGMNRGHGLGFGEGESPHQGFWRLAVLCRFIGVRRHTAEGYLEPFQ